MVVGPDESCPLPLRLPILVGAKHSALRLTHAAAQSANFYPSHLSAFAISFRLRQVSRETKAQVGVYLAGVVVVKSSDRHTVVQPVRLTTSVPGGNALPARVWMTPCSLSARACQRLQKTAIKQDAQNISNPAANAARPCRIVRGRSLPRLPGPMHSGSLLSCCSGHGDLRPPLGRSGEAAGDQLILGCPRVAAEIPQ
jgi:hypothetical protein